MNILCFDSFDVANLRFVAVLRPVELVLSVTEPNIVSFARYVVASLAYPTELDFKAAGPIGQCFLLGAQVQHHFTPYWQGFKLFFVVLSDTVVAELISVLVLSVSGRKIAFKGLFLVALVACELM